jgi:hypothetical protein
VNTFRRHAQYLWLVPVAAILAVTAIVAHNPRDARFRREVIGWFERAERIEFYAAGNSEPTLVVGRGGRLRRFVLYGVRESYVTARCPAEADTRIEIYLPASPPQQPFEQVRHLDYHTTCGQLTPVAAGAPVGQAAQEAPGGGAPPAGRALAVGRAFRSVAPRPKQASACPPEFCPQ